MILLISTPIFAIEGYVELSKNEIINQIQWTINIKKELLMDDLYIGIIVIISY